MNIDISGSCEINKFELQNFEKKLKDILEILPAAHGLSAYFSKKGDLSKVVMKSKIKFGQKQKCLRFHAVSDNKNTAINTVIKKLTVKYFKIKNKYGNSYHTEPLRVAI